MPKLAKPVVWTVYVRGIEVGTIKASPTREFAIDERIFVKNKELSISTILPTEHKLSGSFIHA